MKSQAPLTAENFSNSARKISADWKFIVLISAFHLLLVLPLAYILNVWMDEASTLHTTEYGFLHAFQHAAIDEKQAPLYFYILSLWRIVDHSIFFARLFAVCCSLLSIKFFNALAQRFFSKNEARFITLVFAFHPVLIWASLEIRVYALVILLTILLLKLCFETYFENENLTAAQRRNREIIYVLLAVFAVYTNYYLGFILVGNFCALIATRKFSQAKKYFLQMIFVGACLIPMIWIIKQQFVANTDRFQNDTSLYQGIQMVWWHLINFLFPFGFPPFGENSAIFEVKIFPIRSWAIRFGLAAFVFLFFKSKFSIKNNDKILFLGAVTAAVCLCLFGFYFFVGGDYVAPRHAVPLFVALNLFVFSVCLKVLPRRSWVIFAAIFTFLFSYSFHVRYAPLAKRGDWARVAEFIEQNEKPNQPIIIFRNFDALCLPYYYHGVNQILPDKNFFAWNNEESLTSENALKNQTEFVTSQIPPDAPEIWLATEEICQKKQTKAACQPLEDFVNANYTVVATQNFYLERVRLLRKK